jgi:hypothetical protein
VVTPQILALRADSVAVDRAPERVRADQSLADHLQPGVVPRLRALFRIEVVQRIGAALPFEPEPARLVVDEAFLDLDPHAAREILRALADQEMMVGLLRHQLRDLRRGAHAFDARDGAGLFLRPVHARRIELDDTVGIRQSAPADAGLIGVELDDADARDEGVQHVGPLRHHPECLRDAGDVVGVLRRVAVPGRDDDRLHALRRQHGRGLPEERFRNGRRRDAGGGGGLDELAAVQLFHDAVLLAALIIRQRTAL